MVARQGQELDWHFAHEKSEAPECPAGALNLLRRLVVEELVSSGRWVSHPFSVPHPLPGNAPLAWTAHPSGPIQPADAGSSSDASAFVSLREGGLAAVHVCIGNESIASEPGEEAVLMAWLPDPVGQLRDEAGAREFVRRNLALRWHRLHDHLGLYAAAEAEARRAQARWVEAEAAERARRSAEAGARWGAIRKRMASGETEGDAHLANATDRPSVPNRTPSPPWAPGLAAGTSIHYRLLDDGTRWVCYRSEQGEYRLRQVPEPTDGWDECFPPSVATPTEDEYLRVVDFGKLLLLFNAHAKESQIDSDPQVIAERFNRQ